MVGQRYDRGPTAYRQGPDSLPTSSTLQTTARNLVTAATVPLEACSRLHGDIMRLLACRSRLHGV